MHRIVHHHAYVDRAFGEVCACLDGDGAGRLETATRAAAARAARLAPHVRALAAHFDVDENVRIVASPLRRHQETASMAVSWIADPGKRLLPNVAARLDVNPVVAEGPHATTELFLHGEYAPTTSRDLRSPEFFLQRRVVDAILHTFMAHLADAIDPPPPELAADPRSS